MQDRDPKVLLLPYKECNSTFKVDRWRSCSYENGPLQHHGQHRPKKFRREYNDQVSCMLLAGDRFFFRVYYFLPDEVGNVNLPPLLLDKK